MPGPDLSLPIEPALPALREALAESVVAVLQAPPGAGKTTRVPLALLDEPWIAGGRIVMLEPRRLAARAAARRMAEMFGEEVGVTVGYRVRHDTRVGPHPGGGRTEGVLTRMLQSDPLLAGTDLLPSHIQVANGSRIPVDYSDPEAPVLAVRLQELFGVTETPRPRPERDSGDSASALSRLPADPGDG